jgi:hypothetical protein
MIADQISVQRQPSAERLAGSAAGIRRLEAKAHSRLNLLKLACAHWTNKEIEKDVVS